jgi:hypothetical protein
MELTGEQELPLARERVWAALNDPQVLRACIPGCESFERVDENQYQMVMAAAVGPVKARFTGKLKLTELQPPESYALTFEGSGGAAGFGKGGAQVELEAEGAASTRLRYRAHAQVGGRLAQVGARLIDGVAKKMAEDFFARFKAGLMPPAAAEAASEPAPAATAAGSRRTWLWVAGVVIVIAAIAAYEWHR